MALVSEMLFLLSVFLVPVSRTIQGSFRQFAFKWSSDFLVAATATSS
jgi:hypothetical protein